MGSFQLPADEAVVVIDQGRYAGAEITVNRDVGMGTLLTAQRLMRRTDGETIEEKTERLGALYTLLVEDVLVAWNLTDRRDRPIPLTVEGMGRVPPELVGEVLAGWTVAVLNPTAPPAAGETSPE